MEFESYSLIIKSSSKGLLLQQKDGSFPKGHDGPWYNEDTFLRTTAHWALLLLKAYELTNDKLYYNGIVKACNFLLREEARPYNYTFYCRKINTGKDRCNGLIGQAWVLEALILAGHQLGEEKYLSAARDVLQMLPYDFNNHSWSAIEIDGRALGEYGTLNQQIWLTSMAFLLGIYSGDGYYSAVSNDFFSNLHGKISLLDGGIIKHSYSQDRWLIKKQLKRALKKVKNNELNSRQGFLSISYLTFLLYGIAIVIDKIPKEQIWKILKQDFIIEAIKYIENNYPYGYLEDPDSYRWSYNPIGIEMAYILQVMAQKSELLSDDQYSESKKERIRKWLGKQIEGYYDFNVNLLSKNTNDPNILSARFYEAVRLENYKIDIYL